MPGNAQAPASSSAAARSPERVNRRGKRGGGRGRKRQQTLRALKTAVATTAEIQGAAKARQRKRLGGEINSATGLDTDLVDLYDRFSEEKAAIFRPGLVKNGQPLLRPTETMREDNSRSRKPPKEKWRGE